jgi:hypothetical protein
VANRPRHEQDLTPAAAPVDLEAIAFGPSGALYATQSGPGLSRIVRLDLTTGEPVVLAGGAPSGSVDGVGTEARFVNLGDLTFDGDRSLLVIERGATARVRRIDVPTGLVTTVFREDDITLANIACDGRGRIFVADSNNVIYDLPHLLPDVVVVDAPTGPVGERRTVTASPQTATEQRFRLIIKPSLSSAVLAQAPGGGVTVDPDFPAFYRVELTSSNASGEYRRSSVSFGATDPRCVPATVSAVPSVGGSVTATPLPGCPAGQFPSGSPLS